MGCTLAYISCASNEKLIGCISFRNCWVTKVLLVRSHPQHTALVGTRCLESSTWLQTASTTSTKTTCHSATCNDQFWRLKRSKEDGEIWKTGVPTGVMVLGDQHVHVCCTQSSALKSISQSLAINATIRYY